MFSRSIYIFAFLLCLAGLLFGFYLQYFQSVRPCILCLLQRGSLLLSALFLLIALLHRPQKIGERIYAVLVLLSVGLGVFASLRQIWLEHQPQSQTLSCLPDMKYLFTHLPLTQALQIVLKGSSDCGKIGWTLLGWSLAEWSFFLFGLLALLMLVSIFRKPR